MQVFNLLNPVGDGKVTECELLALAEVKIPYHLLPLVLACLARSATRCAAPRKPASSETSGGAQVLRGAGGRRGASCTVEPGLCDVTTIEDLGLAGSLDASTDSLPRLDTSVPCPAEATSRCDDVAGVKRRRGAQRLRGGGGNAVGGSSRVDRAGAHVDSGVMPASVLGRKRQRAAGPATAGDIDSELLPPKAPAGAASVPMGDGEASGWPGSAVEVGGRTSRLSGPGILVSYVGGQRDQVAPPPLLCTARNDTSNQSVFPYHLALSHFSA
jgi:hypothetical protein